MSDTGPLFVTSGDLIADRRYKWALDLAERGDLAAAADILVQTVELAPGFAAAWFALGTIRDRLSDRTGAITAFEKALDTDPDDRHGARLHLARLGEGQAAPPMSEAYIRLLFDQYAGRFDAALVERLSYRAPAALRDAVDAIWRQQNRKLGFAAALDLGCGTGLGGAAFRDIAEKIIGVDLSPAMISKAEAKHLYDRLATADLAVFLAGKAARQARYDLIVAADVFVYVNDLVPIMQAIAAVLMPGGIIAFTVETHGGVGVKLLPTMRYAHSKHHIRDVLAGSGLEPRLIEPTSVRSEKSIPVASLVVVAEAVRRQEGAEPASR